MDDVEQVDGVELLGGAELRQTLDGGAVVGEGRDDRKRRPAAALPLLAKKTIGAAHARRLPGLLQKISVSALRSILLGGVRIDAHQLLRDAEGGLQKRDRVLRQPLRLRVQRRDLRQERLEPEGLRSGVLRAGDELCRGNIEAFGDLFNGIRPQAVFSFQIALKCRARNAELFGKFQLAFLLRFHPVPQCGCNVFLYLHKATSLNKKIRMWVQLVNASLPANRPAFRHMRRGQEKLCIYHYKRRGNRSQSEKETGRSPWTEISLF